MNIISVFKIQVVFTNVKFFVFFMLTCFFFNNYLAQNIKIGREEKKWVFIHPIASWKIKKIAKKCFVIYQDSSIKNKLDRFDSGGQRDAFRHVFYMAAFAQKIKVKKLKKLGMAHEKQNYLDFLNLKTEFGELADSLNCIMDLENNELGFKIGLLHKKTNLTELSHIVLLRILSGEALIMKRNSKGQYLSCQNEIIELENYKNKWQIPKCLVSSNFH